MSFTEAVAAANAKGLYIHELSQLMDVPAFIRERVPQAKPTGVWRCYLRHESGWLAVGEGDSVMDAMGKAFQDAEGYFKAMNTKASLDDML